MIEGMTRVMLFVKDYTGALDFYTNKLGFVKVTDFSPAPGWRFCPSPQKGRIQTGYLKTQAISTIG